MARKPKKEERTDEWLATFADTMTLLLTFFVLLYSMSTVNEQKLMQVSNSFQLMFTGSSSQNIMDFNTSSGQVPVVGQSEVTQGAQDNLQDMKDNVYQQVMEIITENNMQSEMEVFEDEKGINIQMKETVLFESGKADLLQKSKEILSKINTVIANVNNKIIIEGHTDNVPINSVIYPTNWHLSSARSISVLQYFIQEKGNKNPERFMAVACGEYSPIVPNDSDANRAKNRRVNIIIVTNEKE
ncbi:MAG: flagellar motor protein MotB [Clostridium sp.]